jgi:hypothetical protein
VLLHEDPNQLAVWHKQIITFLAERLGLALRDAGLLRPISKGIDFLGYIVRPGYCLVRRRVAVHLDERLRYFAKRLLRKGRQGLEMDLSRETRKELQVTLASYLGHYRHASAWRLAQGAFIRYPWLNDLFLLHDGLRLQPLWEPPTVNSIRRQWYWFVRHKSDHLVLIQVGNRVEIYDTDAEYLHKRFGLPLQAVPRPRFSATISLPLRRLRDLRAQLRRQRLGHLFIAEDGWLPGGMKRRVLRLCWTPCPTTPSTQLVLPFLSSNKPTPRSKTYVEKLHCPSRSTDRNSRRVGPRMLRKHSRHHAHESFRRQ